MPNKLTNEQTDKLHSLLGDLECVFLSIKNLAPNLENDVSVDGDIKCGVAWDQVMGGLGLQGKQLVDAAFSIFAEAEKSNAA